MSILMPAVQNQFIVRFADIHLEECTQDVVKVDLDLLNKRVRVLFRQPQVERHFHEYVRMVNLGSSPIIVVRHYSQECFNIEFIRAKVVSHSMKFEYGSDQPVIHDIEWSFDQIASPRTIVAPSEKRVTEFPTPEEFCKANTDKSNFGDGSTSPV